MMAAEQRTSPPALTEQPWQALLDSAGEGIWGVDLAGTCTFINRAACAALGYSSEELVGQNMHAMVHHHYPDGRDYPGAECIVYNVFRRSQPFTNHIDHLFRRDGSMFYAEMSAQPILEGGKTLGAVVTFRDITQSQLAEQALRRSEKLAAVGQLASSIAHEINNPLEAVTNLIYLVRHAQSLEEVREFATQAEAELSRVAEIVTQTLRFHRQQTAAALVNVGELIPALLRLYSTRFRQRDIALRLQLQPSPQAMLLEGEIRQVVNNLVRNAYDAMPHGGQLHIRLRPATSLRSAGIAGLRITVADTGTGFQPVMRKHLFEPFHTTKEVTGTGLGLWITKSIVDKHAGTIHMRSRMREPADGIGHGTVFSLWLPLRPPGAVTAKGAEPGEEMAGAGIGDPAAALGTLR